MKRATKVISTLAVIIVIAFAGTTVSDVIAVKKSERICKSIKPGMQKQEIISIVENNGGYHHFMEEENVTVGASGWNLICRCKVNMSQSIAVRVGDSQCID